MSDLLSSDAIFSVDEKAFVGRLANLMIPATEDRPGAADAAIMARILARLEPHAALIRDAMAGIGENFRQIDDETLMARVDASLPRPTRAVFQSQVATSYFEDPRVMEAIGLPPRPAFPEGYEIESPDWGLLLAPVRARGRVFRDVGDG